jgi:hypothetical protein
VTPQFREHPLPVQQFFSGVVQNMHLPKGQQDSRSSSFIRLNYDGRY